jgi:hypothetical protein
MTDEMGNESGMGVEVGVKNEFDDMNENEINTCVVRNSGR